ncbi:MAG: hypothetical protein ACI8P9_003372 [Parasphingorhabdus sp.]|jgi:hypothetical protein
MPGKNFLKVAFVFIIWFAPYSVANAQSSSDAEVIFWQSISSGSVCSEYQAYAEAFPNGTFVSLANVRINQYCQTSQSSAPSSTNSNKTTTKPVSKSVAAGYTGELKECYEAVHSIYWLEGNYDAKYSWYNCFKFVSEDGKRWLGPKKDRVSVSTKTKPASTNSKTTTAPKTNQTSGPPKAKPAGTSSNSSTGSETNQTSGPPKAKPAGTGSNSSTGSETNQSSGPPKAKSAGTSSNSNAAPEVNQTSGPPKAKAAGTN